MHVTHFAGPAGSADALIGVIFLPTLSTVFTRLSCAPVDKLVTSFTLVAVWTVASIVVEVVNASGTIGTGI